MHESQSDPSSLFKQLVVLMFISGLFLWFYVQQLSGALISLTLVVLTALATFCDAWTAGIRKRKGVRSMLNISPLSWGLLMELFLIVAYPLYLLNRKRLQTKDSNNIWWIAVCVLGALALFLAALSLFGRASSPSAELGVVRPLR